MAMAMDQLHSVPNVKALPLLSVATAHCKTGGSYCIDEAYTTDDANSCITAFLGCMHTAAFALTIVLPYANLLWGMGGCVTFYMLLNIALHLRLSYIAKQAALSTTQSYSSYGANGYLQQPLADDYADRCTLDGSYHGALPRVFTDVPTTVEEASRSSVDVLYIQCLCAASSRHATVLDKE
eukprot:11551-Heterococcus_DN1.PRE.2